jgi:hypothetical protein
VNVNGGLRDHPSEGLWLFAGSRKKHHVSVWLRCDFIDGAAAGGCCGAEELIADKRCQIATTTVNEGRIARLKPSTSWHLAAQMAVPDDSSWSFRRIRYKLLELDELASMGRGGHDAMRYSTDMFIGCHYRSSRRRAFYKKQRVGEGQYRNQLLSRNKYKSEIKHVFNTYNHSHKIT